MNSESVTCTVICRNLQNISHVTQTCHTGCSDKTADGLKPFIGNYKFRVDIMYGPINVCGIIKHRSERVKHVKEKLKKLGFTVSLRRFWLYERVMFAFEGQVVLSCNIKYLSFKGYSVTDDNVTKRAMRKLKNIREYVKSNKS